MIPALPGTHSGATGYSPRRYHFSLLNNRLFDHAHTHVTIYQIIDDASRFDVGTTAFALPENGTDARATLAAAFAAYGKPQEILSDNGDAFATYHRGFLSATETWLASQGVLAIAGFAPTTQGKDERSHRTLTQFLDARHPASLAEVNTYLAEYRQVYNEQRRHQSLLVGKMHITPRQAFDTFPRHRRLRIHSILIKSGPA